MNAALIRRRLVHGLRRLGAPGMAGLVLLLAAGLFAAAVVLPARDRMQQLDRRIAAADAKLQAPAVGAGQPQTPGEQLVAFYQTFPKGTTVPDWLGKIYGIAGEQKLSLDVGEYALTQSQAGRLDRFRISLPIKGSYPQIRRFIAAALATAPALSLESVYFKREKVAEGSVDAKVVFLLYLEKGA